MIHVTHTRFLSYRQRSARLVLMTGLFYQASTAWAAQTTPEIPPQAMPPKTTPQNDVIDALNDPKGIHNGIHLPNDNTDIKTAEQLLDQQQQNLSQLSVAELKQNPQLYGYVLNAALAAQDLPTVKRLLPEYRKLSQHDPIMIEFADALLYRANDQHQQAIDIYQRILQQNPEYHPVRLHLAATYNSDKRHQEALGEYLHLKQVKDLPAPVLQVVDTAIADIKKMQDWQFSITANPLREVNIDNVPTTAIQNRLGFYTPEPKTLWGLQVAASANKRTNLPKHLYHNVGVDLTSKIYKDSDYNDNIATVSAGIGYDDAKSDLSISPFFSHRRYDDKPYSNRYGVNLAASRWLTPKLQASSSAQFATNRPIEDKQSTTTRTDKAYTQFYGVNGIYVLTPKQYLFGGVSLFDNNATGDGIVDRDRYNYDVKRVSLGWGKNWDNKLSTRTSVSYSQKQYDTANRIRNHFYLEPNPNAIQKDKVYAVNLQLWRRGFDIYGLTPRLSLQYQQTNSNLRYYDNRHETTANIILTKDF